MKFFEFIFLMIPGYGFWIGFLTCFSLASLIFSKWYSKNIIKCGKCGEKIFESEICTYCYIGYLGGKS